MATKITIPSCLKDQKFIKTKEKLPIEKDWNTKNSYTLNQINQWLVTNNTYGILCGYNNLLVIDFDDKPTQESFIQENPQLTNTFTVQTATKKLLHFYYYTDRMPESFKCFNEQQLTLADGQGIGKQVIGANSQLANGSRYEVTKDLPILKVNYLDIKAAVMKYNKYTKNNTIFKANWTKAMERVNDPLRDEIKQKISISFLLSSFGCDISKNPTTCPFHDSVKGKCLSFNDSEGLWKCFHCDRGGDLFTLYCEMKKVDFVTAKKQLADMAGIKNGIELGVKDVKELMKELREQVKMENTREREMKKIDTELKENKKLFAYLELKVNKFKIFKGKEETHYKVLINDVAVNLNGDEILIPDNFRKKLFAETGLLLPPISKDKWTEVVNEWFEKCGETVDVGKEDNTNDFIIESFINELNSFKVVYVPKEATSYSRVYFNRSEADHFFVCNRTIENLKKKFEFKITLGKLRFLLEDYLDGKSRVIKTGTESCHRFWCFKRESLTNLEVKEEIIDTKEEVANVCEESLE